MSDATEDRPLIEVDESNLDRECIKLPSTFLKYAYAGAEARKDLDEAKAALELAEAELGAEIRQDPEAYKLEKATEKAVEQVVITLPRYRKMLSRYQNAKYKLEELQAVLSALEMKKRSITLLVDLHGMGYFSSPRISPDGKKAVEQMRKQKVRRVRDED